jgi:hypothetical protein
MGQGLDHFLKDFFGLSHHLPAQPGKGAILGSLAGANGSPFGIRQGNRGAVVAE